MLPQPLLSHTRTRCMALRQLTSLRLLPTPIPTTRPIRRPVAATVTQIPVIFRARMSTGRKFEWLVVVPDKPGMQPKRLEVRAQHLANVKPLVESGQCKMGGAVLAEMPPDDEPTSLKFAGSSLVVVAESKEEIVQMLRNDIYGTMGVWDVDNAQIWPFKCVFRHP